MPVVAALGGCSIFVVLFAQTGKGISRQRRQRQRRFRWFGGRLHVGFDRTKLVDDASKRVMCVVSGTGILPNAVFSMMESADNGLAWKAGVQLNVAMYAVQILEVMRLHLLPYATCISGADGGVAAPGGNDDDDDDDRGYPVTDKAVSSLVARASRDVVGTSSCRLLQQRRLSHELAWQLQEAYPHFFS